MNKLILPFLCSILLVFVSCKKNKYEPDILDGDLSYLVGTWEWDSTYHRYNWCTGGATIEEVIYKETDEFKLVFEENGYVTYLANDSLIFKKGVTIDYYEKIDEFSYHTTIFLEGNSEEVFSLIGGVESTNVGKYPYDEYDGGCEDYINYFSKE